MAERERDKEREKEVLEIKVKGGQTYKLDGEQYFNLDP